MSNSSLAKEKYIAHSNNYTVGRSGRKIEKVTIHHMAGVLTAKQCGAIFQNGSRKASSNYGIGRNGEIALYVDEKNTSYADGNWDSNCKSVTIECSNNKTGGDWTISDTVLNSLVNLVADILKRNKLGKAIVGKTITWHSMYMATTCPGNYLRKQMDYIAQKVNEKLGETTVVTPVKPTIPNFISNSNVLEWQKTINKVYGEKLALDGIFGPNCEKVALKHLLYLTSPMIKNDYVKFVQKLFISKGYSLATDGIFGPDCKSKTIAFQKANGLTQDGYIGPATIKLLLV